MTYSTTASRSQSTAMTAVRVRNVLFEVGADFYNLVPAKLATEDQVNKWAGDLQVILENEAARSFQVQLTCNGRKIGAIEYVVSADGTLMENGKAGGVNYFSFPAGTKASLFVAMDYASKNIEYVKQYLRDNGWGFDGVAVSGSSSRNRAYSSDGYGVVRNFVGAIQ
jgi:hypothetical protein